MFLLSQKQVHRLVLTIVMSHCDTYTFMNIEFLCYGVFRATRDQVTTLLLRVR